VRFAAERTLLAWIRTRVALMGFGFVVARFAWLLREIAQQGTQSLGCSLAVGVGLILLGVVVDLLA
jgi:putative membrane protein